MSKIDALLTLILDGGWHDKAAIATAMEIKYDQLGQIIRLLSEFDFIQTKEREIRIDPDTKKLLESFSRNPQKRQKGPSVIETSPSLLVAF